MAARNESARAKSAAREVETENREDETKTNETKAPETSEKTAPETSAEEPKTENPETGTSETGPSSSSDKPDTGTGNTEGSATGTAEGETKENEGSAKNSEPESLLSADEIEKIRRGAKAFAEATEEDEERVFSDLFEKAVSRKAEEVAKAAEERFNSALKEITEKREKELSAVRKYLPGYKPAATSKAARSPSSNGNGSSSGIVRTPKSADFVRSEGARTLRNTLTGKAILAAYDENGVSLSELSEFARAAGRKDSEEDAKRILFVDVAYIKGYGVRKEERDGETRFFLVLPEGLDSPVFKD